MSDGRVGAIAPNPRLAILRRDIEQSVLKPLRSHGWTADMVAEFDHHDSIEIEASKRNVKVRIAVLYSSATDNAHYRELATRVERIFFNGEPYRVADYTAGVNVPVEPLSEFFQYLIVLNKRLEPDRSPAAVTTTQKPVRRITGENPVEGVFARLRQFTSVEIARKLVVRRAKAQAVELASDVIAGKAAGVAYSMRNALDYVAFSSSDRMNRRILSLYYGAMAFAFAEMLADPRGPIDLDEVEGMTKQGHGLYTLTGPEGGFADLRVGVLATGFLPRWLSFLGHDISIFPKEKVKNSANLDRVAPGTVCTLRDLFASMPEVDDLFAEVFGDTPRWIVPTPEMFANGGAGMFALDRTLPQSTYANFYDASGQIEASALEKAGWPIAEIAPITEGELAGKGFRARVDHAGHKFMWDVLPLHRAPFGHRTTMLFPTLGGMREYRTIALTTLYALSIMVRYMPSLWRRIEGGDEDQYEALVDAALAVWERVLPERFLESIAGEIVYTSQPGAFGA
ncbi:MAG: hypothetical protein P4M15_15555 [Alphaproteobacteria bacterium]|nr:hypothetical protein [Alphaproteobacteria bacterium]